MTRPLIGITVDNLDSNVASGKYESNIEYSRTVAEAGGLPLLLPQQIELAQYYVDLCDGVIFTGGDDARTEDFGIPAHPQSRCIDSRRQSFEMALFDALAKKPSRPVLGVCLGMQLMALHAGGRMNQHLPETLSNAVEVHQNNQRHPVQLEESASALLASSEGGIAFSGAELASETVVSSHHQAVISAGRLRIVAKSPDGVIEAVDDPNRAFYVGVQWHPERGAGYLNRDLIRRFVDACGRSRAQR